MLLLPRKNLFLSDMGVTVLERSKQGHVGGDNGLFLRECQEFTTELLG